MTDTAPRHMLVADELDRSILVVDDEPHIRDVLALFLRRMGFEVSTAADGSQALEQLRERPYFLVITDVNMPGLSGLELLSEVRAMADPADAAPTDVIIVTGEGGKAPAVEALRRGAYDFFSKPFSFEAMTFTVRRLLERRRLKREAQEYTALSVRIKAEEEHARQAVDALVEAVYAKDRYTRGHMERVGRIAAELGRYTNRSDEDVELLRRAGALHDIGKIGTPDAVLNKPGPLDEREWEAMRLHPEVGANILMPIRVLSPVCTPVHCHHERWDGSGYPDKTGGEDIPELARILAVADVCDALHSDRAYRAGLPESTVREIISAGSGKLFDPQVVEALLDLCEQGRIFQPLASSESDRRVSDKELDHPC